MSLTDEDRKAAAARAWNASVYYRTCPHSDGAEHRSNCGLCGFLAGIEYERERVKREAVKHD